MPEDQVNDPKTCPNVKCRSKEFEFEDVRLGDGGGAPPDGAFPIECTCLECGWTWRDEYRLEFIHRSDVQRG